MYEYKLSVLLREHFINRLIRYLLNNLNIYLYWIFPYFGIITIFVNCKYLFECQSIIADKPCLFQLCYWVNVEQTQFLIHLGRVPNLCCRNLVRAVFAVSKTRVVCKIQFVVPGFNPLSASLIENFACWLPYSYSIFLLLCYVP